MPLGPDQPIASPPPRVAGVVVVGMSMAVWWPAFTLGAWGVFFFDQILTVWAAATAALIVVIFRHHEDRNRLGRAAALLLPSLWLVLAIAVDPGDDSLNVAIDVLGGSVAVLGIPATIWVLARIIWPEFGHDLPLRRRLVVAASVAAIAVVSYLLGVNHDAFLTCEAFTLSGNSEPPGCRRA